MADAYGLLGADRAVQVMFVRSLGALAALWAVQGLVWPGTWLSDFLFVLAYLPIAAASVGLMAARRAWIVASALSLAVGCVIYLFAHSDRSNSPVVLLLWAAVIVAATDRCPLERALLLRVCVTCVYGFTALAKTNPSFLAGDQMVRIATTREHMAWAMDLMMGPVGVLLALATVLSEYTLAVGLWFTRTRMMVALLGIVLHITLIPAAASSWRDVFFLIVLNAGLVAMYPAFWSPIRSTSVDQPVRQARVELADAVI